MSEGLILDNIKAILPAVRQKHPKTSFEALTKEVGELAKEIQELEVAESNDEKKYRRNRIKAEAIDVAIVAIRIANGECF